MRKSEDGHDKFNQVTGDPYLGGVEEHSDAQALALTAGNLVAEEAETLAVPEEWASFLAPLPLDGASSILKLLETTDLQSVSLVNQTANFLVRDILLKRYKDALEFSQSCLWQYLPTIAQDVPNVAGKAFIDYLEAITNLKFNTHDRIPCEKLSSCMTYMRNREGFPANWSAALTQTASELQTLAQEILAFYPTDAPAEPPKNLKAFMNLCSAQFTTQWQELSLWQKYHKLDSQLSTFLLLYKMNWIRWYNQLPQNRQNQENQHSFVTPLINPKISGLLTGSGLMFLDSCVPGIFSQLVREALWWFKKVDKVEWEIARFKNIECLLGRVTEQNLLEYLPNQYFSRDNPPADPHAVFVDLRQRWAVDPKRALLISVIRSNYTLLLKKFTATVLFKIEETIFKRSPPSREYPLDQSRIIPLILTRPVLLRNLGKADILKLLCIPQSIIIPEHPFLWPYLSYDVIQEWFRIDNLALHESARVVLSNATILKALTNEQIISIAQYLGPKEIAAILDSPAFRKRLEEDKAQSDNQENKLLMQLAESPKKDTTGDFSFSFAPTIAKNSFTRGLLNHAEAMALLFDPKFTDSQASIMSYLLQREDFINTLSSAELLKTVTGRTRCCLPVARSYLHCFNVDDLIDFTDSCVTYITGNNRVELNIIFETLPIELERRAEELTNTQWLSLARKHPQIGNCIIDRYSSKLEDCQLESLSTHYKDNTELLQKITRAIEARAQEKQQQQALRLARDGKDKLESERQRKLAAAKAQEREKEEAKKLKKRLKDQKNLALIRQLDESIARTQQKMQKRQAQQQERDRQMVSTTREKMPWTHYFRLAFFTTLGLVGFALFLLGIGSAVGIPVIVTMTSTLFSFLPWSAALSSFVGGYLVYIAATITAVISFKQTSEISNTSIPEKTTRSKKSSCSTSSFFKLLDCWPQPSQAQDVTHDVALSQVSMRPSTATLGVRTRPVLTSTTQSENDESRTFGFM